MIGWLDICVTDQLTKVASECNYVSVLQRGRRLHINCLLDPKYKEVNVQKGHFAAGWPLLIHMLQKDHFETDRA